MSDRNISNDEIIFAALKRHGVPFIIIGGHAVFRHGYRRTTADVDIVWLRSPESAKALLAALTELHAVWIGKEIDPVTRIECTYPVSPAYIEREHLMMLWTPYGPLDLFDYIPGMPTEDVKQLFETGVEGDGLNFSSLAWLRRMKQVSGRTKDLADLEELAKIHPEKSRIGPYNLLNPTQSTETMGTFSLDARACYRYDTNYDCCCLIQWRFRRAEQALSKHPPMTKWNNSPLDLSNPLSPTGIAFDSMSLIFPANLDDLKLVFEINRSIHALYLQWVAEAEEVYARVRQLIAGGHAVPKMEELDDAMGRSHTMSGGNAQELIHALDQVKRGHPGKGVAR